MTKRMAFGALLLTIATAAAAGSFLYGNGHVDETARITLPSDSLPVSNEVTPEMIAMWKGSSVSAGAAIQKAPI